MTLVLSMNPFLDAEGNPPPSTFPPVWESKRFAKACLSSRAVPRSSEEQFTQEAHCRRAPDHVSVSRIAYFKRKFVDEEESPFSFRSYCHTVAPVLEERAHVLRLSLEKMRFIDDPELFLRRSVLVNNLLRRLRAEILLQSSDLCFPPGPPFTAGPCILPAGAGPAHQLLHRAMPSRICLAPQARPPLRKRLRTVGGVQGELRPDCAQTCCCIYAAAAAAGHYIHFPFSMYDAALSSCPPTPHSSSFFQLAGHSKLGLTMVVDDDEDEDAEEEEEEENEEEEHRAEVDEEDDEQEQSSPCVDVKDKVRQALGDKHKKTEDNCRVEEEGDEPEENGEEEEDEEEERGTSPCLWGSDEESQRFRLWRRRAHRQ
uniref:SERTA domain containing 4 n=1 Tax=Oryzias latipes TaxID=8090 RepID=A0A3P9L7E7_ORYLA